MEDILKIILDDFLIEPQSKEINDERYKLVIGKSVTSGVCERFMSILWHSYYGYHCICNGTKETEHNSYCYIERYLDFYLKTYGCVPASCAKCILEFYDLEEDELLDDGSIVKDGYAKKVISKLSKYCNINIYDCSIMPQENKFLIDSSFYNFHNRRRSHMYKSVCFTDAYKKNNYRRKRMLKRLVCK
jgi:hypothetical protein